MKQAWIIARRELRGLVSSPGGWVVLGTFWLVAGLLLVSLLFRFRDGSIAIAQSGQLKTSAQGVHVNDWVIRPLLYNLGTVLVLFVPLLTMRSFAEERRSGNLELLLSQPLRGADLVMGKFLGSVLGLLLCLSVLAPHFVILALVTRPDWGAAFAGVLGLVLLGLLFSSVGLWISVLTRSQVEAGVLSLGALLLLVIGPGANAEGPSWAQSLLRSVAILTRFEDFTRGILDFGHIAFFFGLVLLVLAAALRSVDLVRWQG